jgi:hypothetical protein
MYVTTSVSTHDGREPFLHDDTTRAAMTVAARFAVEVCHDIPDFVRIRNGITPSRHVVHRARGMMNMWTETTKE